MAYVYEDLPCERFGEEKRSKIQFSEVGIALQTIKLRTTCLEMRVDGAQRYQVRVAQLLKMEKSVRST